MHANSLVTIFRLMKLTRDENVTLFNLSRILNSSYSFLFPISDPSTYNINQSSICHKITHVIHIIQENSFKSVTQISRVHLSIYENRLTSSWRGNFLSFYISLKAMKMLQRAKYRNDFFELTFKVQIKAFVHFCNCTHIMISQIQFYP